MEDCLAAWATEFKTFSHLVKTEEWYATYLAQGQVTRDELMRLALMRLGFDDPERASRLGDAYATRRDAMLKLFPEVPGVIEKLKSRFPLGLVTNGPADVQRQEIATLGIQSDFQYIFIEGEMGRGKPLPEVFRHVESEVRAQPPEILFVGNSYAHDIRPAISAGWRTAWVRRPSDVSPSAGMPEEKPAGAPDPDLEIGNLTAILPLLGLA